MTSLTVNGKALSAPVSPRTHLADFLRETLHLTGTHLGCEHGICGACTLLLDGEPARSCITFATACEGRHVTSIEGLEDDSIMVSLRAAFSVEHALQCGYCTPGMLITARDIVQRLPDADDDRIRLELSGNLCRCTGYNGIVRAIRRVLNSRHGRESGHPRLSLPALPPVIEIPSIHPKATIPTRTATPRLTQHLHIAASREALWQALQNPTLVAACVPGAELISVDQNHITGKMSVSLGPIKGEFLGTADVTYGDFTGTIRGEGQDKISKTRLSAEAQFTVTADGSASILTLSINYNLRGALAQFARGPVVAAFADEITRIVAQNLAARLNGETITTAPPRLGAASLAWRVILRRLNKLFRA